MEYPDDFMCFALNAATHLIEQVGIILLKEVGPA